MAVKEDKPKKFAVHRRHFSDPLVVKGFRMSLSENPENETLTVYFYGGDGQVDTVVTNVTLVYRVSNRPKKLDSKPKKGGDKE